MSGSFKLVLAALVAWFGACPSRELGDGPVEAQELMLRAGVDLQDALDEARPGDVITLEAGAVFTGPFELPEKSGEGWITIRSSQEARLPPSGQRVSPLHSLLMPKLEAASGTVIATEPGAHQYRFVGIEIRPARGAFLFNLVTLGSDEVSADLLPRNIVFERCYLHGDSERGTRRGIALNSRDSAVVDSYFADFKEVGADSQAIAGWNGPGPFRIENNYLEGAGENVMFGGADPSIENLVPSDIVIRGNHFKKPLTWRTGEPGFEGRAWTVKNLFELKNARRVLVEGNLFENNWIDAQSGVAILFTVRNQDGNAPWSVVEDVTFARNVVRHAASGVSILGHDDIFPSRQTRRIIIRNNIFEDIGGPRWGGGGRLFQIFNATADVVIEHNTAFQTDNLISAEGPPHAGFVYRNNIAFHNAYGIIGTDLAPGLPTLEALFPGAEVRRNVFIGGGQFPLPPENFFPGSIDEVGFQDHRSGNFRLRPESPYRGQASDGKDIGVDFAAFEAGLVPLPRSARPPEFKSASQGCMEGSDL
jgi:hypothetical protein